AERDQLDAEEARAREAAQRLRQLLTLGENDIAREGALDKDAEAAIAQLSDEEATLAQAAARADTETQAASAREAELRAALSDAETRLERITAELAEWNASKA